MRNLHSPCPLLYCNRCNYKSETRDGFARHCRKQHDAKDYKSDFLRFIKTNVGIKSETRTFSNSSLKSEKRGNEFPLHFMAHQIDDVNRKVKVEPEFEKSSKSRRMKGKVPLYECDVCDMTSVIQSRVRQHMLDNHRPNPLFKCSLCIFQSYEKFKFRDHCRTKHSISPNDLIQFAEGLYCK